MWIESNPPPAYHTHEDIPPSCEATMAPAYTPIQTSPDQAGTSSPSSRASRHLPPSRPLQRSDRLELTNQSTTINIGRPSERDEECGNTPTSSTKSSKSDTCFGLVGAIFALCFVCMFVTMVCTAIFLSEDAAALKESSRVLDRVYGPKHTVTQTVTRLEPGLASTITVTAEIYRTVGTVTHEYVERITETVTQTKRDVSPTDM